MPIQTAIVVLTRSTTATLRNSSSLVPPSLLVSVLRWKAVATSLVLGRVRQQVAGELLDRELVERLVGVERPDDVVAVGPDRARRVVGVAGRVGVAGQVEPHPAPVLAVGGLGEQAIDEPFVGVGARVVGRTRRLPPGSAAGRSGRGRARRTSAYRSASGEGVSPSRSSRARTKRSIAFLGQDASRHLGQLAAVPASRTTSACVYGAPLRTHSREALDLARRELLARRWRRHHLVGVVGRDPADQLALFRVAPDDRGVAAQVGECSFLGVEPQRLADPLALLGVGAVAWKQWLERIGRMSRLKSIACPGSPASAPVPVSSDQTRSAPRV